ncbi:D-2-hydroxyacid dehydrogenase [Galbitalea soli]|uniref:D-2-hydroxyacid dehydrogenase n=1 Tax=Galbitalea soli TaxID=1268042 RepID=A0A7C9TQU6_9MICO|nr:D-2-hydroxyacid dehydrogenase [Galbitalea soli]
MIPERCSTPRTHRPSTPSRRRTPKAETVTETPTSTLRAVVATPLSEDLCRLIEEREPRVRLVRDQTLLPPMRWPGDHGGDPAFTRTPEQQTAFDALVDSAEVLYGIPDESPLALARTVAANPGLRWVQTMAAGGGTQVKLAGLAGSDLERLVVTTSAGVHARSLAEFAVFGVLAGAKSLPRLSAFKESNQWTGRWTMGQVSEQTVLVVGLGSIGRETARLLYALGARVWGTSRSESAVEGVERIIHPDDLADVIGAADAVVVTLPGTDATERLVSARVLGRTKRGATLVSVGRGTVIDEDALIEVLRDGHLGFAALDVFAVEPLSPDSELWTLPNVVLSPHTAALTDAEDRLIAELFAENATRLLDGREMINIINKREFY